MDNSGIDNAITNAITYPPKIMSLFLFSLISSSGAPGLLFVMLMSRNWKVKVHKKIVDT